MRSVLLAALLLALPFAGCLGGAPVTPSATAPGERLARGVTDDPGWPDPAEATLRPGVVVRAKERDCTSNFLFARPDNTSLFLGVAAHCLEGMGVGDRVILDPGRTDSPAMIVYVSWITMHERGETDPDMREYNDFAVLRIDPKDRHHAHPALPGGRGPAGMADGSAVTAGDTVQSYAPSDALPLGPWHTAIVTARAGDWALLVHGLPPALPGTLGGAVLTSDGHALGLTVNLAVAPHAGSNAVARLDTVMAYAAAHANMYMTLVTADRASDAANAPTPLAQALPSLN